MEKSGFKIVINIKKVVIAVCIFIALLLCIRLYHYFFSATGVSKIGSLINTVGYEQGDRADFHTADNGLYFATKDGVIFFNKNASSIVWQDSYTMMNPFMKGHKNIVGVAEPGGNALAVYNTEGNLYKIQSEGKIVTFDVNEKGGAALISQTDTINAYTESGFTAFMAKNPVSEGMPVACDISDNGRLLAVSYIYTGYTEVESRVVFYSLVNNPENDVDLDADEEMVASFIRDGQILGILNFMNNNTFIALSSNELVCVRLGYDGDAVTCTELWSAPLENTVDAFTTLGDKYVALVLGEKNLNTYESEEPNTLVVYDLRGKVISKTALDKTADGLFDGGNSTAIVKMGRTFKVFDKKGLTVLSYTVSQDVNKLLLYDGKKKAIIVTPKEAYLMDVNTKGIGTLISNIKNDDNNSIGVEIEEESRAEDKQENETENSAEQTTQKSADNKADSAKTTEAKADSKNSSDDKSKNDDKQADPNEKSENSDNNTSIKDKASADKEENKTEENKKTSKKAEGETQKADGSEDEEE